MELKGKPNDQDAIHFASLRACHKPILHGGGAQTVSRNETPDLAHFDSVVIDASDRALHLPSREGLAGRVWLIGGALIAASGWVVISILPLPFASVTVDKPRVSSTSSSEASDFREGDRLRMSETIIGQPTSNRETSTVSTAPAAPPRQSMQQVQRQSTGQPTETPRHMTALKTGAREPEPTAKLVPVPETKPTTIEGWTLRDVTNGTALLEGPNGTWRVARGDTVPGLGTINSIFKWGDRLLVATSSGLISTP
jgi:hypothetical protein